MAEIEKYTPDFQTLSILGATVLSGMGFPIDIHSLEDVDRGSAGNRHHRFSCFPLSDVPYFNGTTLQYAASRIWSGISDPSRNGRLCALDDNYPEHPALYQLQALLNRAVIFRHIFDGMKLYAYRWPHTKRVSYVNALSENPSEVLAREFNKDTLTHLTYLNTRDEFASPSLTDSELKSLDGAKDKVATDSLPLAVALMTSGFAVQTHLVGRSCAFIIDPKAELSSAHIPEMNLPPITRVWGATELIDNIESKSDLGRLNKLEDIDPESPVLYSAMAIVNFYHILNAIRKPTQADGFRLINSKAGPRHAVIPSGPGAATSFDTLVKLFKRRSGRYSGQVPLI